MSDQNDKRLPDLTELDIRNLRHMTGADSAKPGYRNHFVTGHGSESHESMERLRAHGLVYLRKTPEWMSATDLTYHATTEGKVRIGLCAHD